jgi:transposase-like protein
MNRIEVITSVERRRRWSRAEKERWVGALEEPGAVAAEIARAAGVDRSLLYRWRQQLAASREVPCFVPVAIADAAPERVVELSPSSAITNRRARASRGPRKLPDDLPVERIVEPAPCACSKCGGVRLRKLGEDVSKTLECPCAREIARSPGQTSRRTFSVELESQPEASNRSHRSLSAAAALSCGEHRMDTMYITLGIVSMLSPRPSPIFAYS